MPRKARIDAPAALHHILCRGIERKRIFRDKTDRDLFLERLGSVLVETSTTCYARALIPNHFHLLLRTGTVPIATVMRRLLTGYAINFNLRHHRHGQLFQNRYKSILCQEDAYLFGLVRYIHLNPLRARLQYRAFVEAGLDENDQKTLAGAHLQRGTDGWREVAGNGCESRKKGDERILGDKDFVDAVLQKADERLARGYRIKTAGIGSMSLQAKWRKYSILIRRRSGRRGKIHR